MDTTFENLVQRLQEEGGKLCSSNHFTQTEIAFQNSQGNMAVLDNGLGYIFISDIKKPNNNINAN